MEDPSDAAPAPPASTRRDTAVRSHVHAVTPEEGKRLALAERLARFGHWEGDLVTGCIHWSPELWRIFGLEAREQGLSLEELLGRIHADDRERFSAAIAGGLRGDSVCELEFRIVRPSGEVRHLHGREEVERDSAGQPIRFFGVAQDVTEQKRTKETLLAREQEFRTLAEHTPDLIVRWDRELRRIYVNPAFAAAMGASQEDLVVRSLGEYPTVSPRFASTSVPILRSKLEQVIATGKPTELMIPWCIAGSDALLHIRLVPEFDGSGQLVTALSIARDVTALKRTEEELRALTENSPDLIARVDREHRYLYVNRTVERLSGHPAHLHIGRPIGELYSEARPGSSPAGVASIRRVIDEVFSTGCSATLEGAAILPHGDAVVLDGLFVPEHGPDGAVTSVLVIARDITERKHAEEALRAGEALLRTFLDHAIDGFMVHDAQGVILEVNRRQCEMLGYTREELVGATPALFDPTVTPQIVAQRTAQLDADKTLVFEAHHRRKDGSFYPAEVRIGGFWRDGKRYAVSLVRDITERKQAEETLRASEQAYAGLVNSIDGIVWEADATTFQFTFVSPQAERILGYPPARWVAEATFWADHLHPDDRDQAVNYCVECTRLGRDHEFEYRMIAADGHTVWVHDLVTVICGEDGVPARLRGLMVDITKRKQAEDALRESEQRFRQVVEGIDEIFWLDDAATGAVIYESPAYERIWGRSCASLYASPRSWLEAVHPDDRPRVAALVEKRALDGYDAEYRITRPDGTVRHVHEKTFPIRDTRGAVYRVAGVAEDVTAQRQLAEQLRQSQKMDAIGRLAGGVAHDFNNLLTAIQLQVSMILADAPPDSTLADGLGQIDAGIRRGAKLTSQLLAFGRRQAKAPRVLDLREIVAGLERLIQPLLGESIKLRKDVAPDLPAIEADAGMMEQIIMNLLVNARDAMPGHGEVAILLSEVTIPEDGARPPARAGRFVCLAVRDAGCGIPPENLSRIFEPFFTTKEVSRGTGLGLATVYGIVQEHRGWIDVESAVGSGSTFRVYLPALSRPAAPPSVTHAPKATGGTETILLVEDQEYVRASTLRVLNRLGYRVHAASAGAEAMQLWETLGGHVDLLLTDLTMPGGMTGQQLAAELRLRAPALRVVYMSGYQSPRATETVRLEGGYNFLAKPFLIHELASVLRRQLDEAAK